MTLIKSERIIQLPPERVFNAARQVTKFPTYMPNLDSVEVLADDRNGNTTTRWRASFTVGPLKKSVSWTERDHWNSEKLTCQFELEEGDMKGYSGRWVFTPQDGGTHVLLEVDFTLGLAMLGPMVDKIVNSLMKQNCDELLAALEQIAANED